MVVALFAFALSYAQSGFKKRPTLAVQFSLNDFKTAAEIRQSDLTHVLSSKQFFKFKRMDPGVSVSYLQGLTEHIDFQGTLTGSYAKHPTSDELHNPDGDAHLFLEGVATANFKLFTDKARVSPFITVGVGGSRYNDTYAATIPIGVGFQVRIVEGTFLLVNSQYRIPATEAAAYHFLHSVGFAGALSKKKEDSSSVTTTTACCS